MVVVVAAFFVVDRLVCGKKARQAPEATKKPVAQTAKPLPTDTKQTRSRDQVISSRKRDAGRSIEYTTWGRDPFAEAIRLAQSDSTESDSSTFVLRGVIRKGDEAYVLIGDDILKSGEQKGDLKILDIDKNRVVCKKRGKIVTLVLEEDAVF